MSQSFHCTRCFHVVFGCSFHYASTPVFIFTLSADIFCLCVLDPESVALSQTRQLQKASPKAAVFFSLLLFTFTSQRVAPTPSCASVPSSSPFSPRLLSCLPLALCDAAAGWGQGSGTCPPTPLSRCPPLCSPPLPCPPNPSWAHYDLARLPLSKPELSELITRLAALVPPMLPVKGCPSAFLPGRDQSSAEP